MSFGTYQPFNPTAPSGQARDFSNVVGKSIADNLVNPTDPGKGLLGGLIGDTGNSIAGAMFGAAQKGANQIGQKTGLLPGAPSPEAQQKVAESQQGGGILKLRQPQPMFGGGKSGPGNPFFGGGGGKYTTGGPTIEPQMQTMELKPYQATNIGDTLGIGPFNS